MSIQFGSLDLAEIWYSDADKTLHQISEGYYGDLLWYKKSGGGGGDVKSDFALEFAVYDITESVIASDSESYYYMLLTVEPQNLVIDSSGSSSGNEGWRFGGATDTDETIKCNGVTYKIFKLKFNSVPANSAKVGFVNWGSNFNDAHSLKFNGKLVFSSDLDWIKSLAD